MNIKDIVELAKAGYKPIEVKELMEMASQQNNDESEQNNDESEQNNDESEQNNDESVQNNDESVHNNDESVHNNDESNEISKLNDRIAELEKELKIAQEHNRRSGGNHQEELAPEDHLKDVMRNFY